MPIFVDEVSGIGASSQLKYERILTLGLGLGQPAISFVSPLNRLTEFACGGYGRDADARFPPSLSEGKRTEKGP